MVWPIDLKTAVRRSVCAFFLYCTVYALLFYCTASVEVEVAFMSMKPPPLRADGKP